MGVQDQELEQFLAHKPSWLQKLLQGDFCLSPAEQAEMQRENWPVIFGEAQDRYRVLLKANPSKLREYRKLQKKLAAEIALLNVPPLRPGARQLNEVALEASQLAGTGLSQADIARTLNDKYSERKDRNGNKKPFTEESIRKLLKRRRSPDKT